MERFSTSRKLHSYLGCSPFSALYLMHYFKQKWPGTLLYVYLRIYGRFSTSVKRDYQPQRIPAEAPCSEPTKSYFRHTYPCVQSLVPSLSSLLVRFLRVYFQAYSSRLLVATAACKHQSRLTQSTSKRSYNVTDLRMKPPTIPHGNDRCAQTQVSSHSRSCQIKFRFLFPSFGFVCCWTEAASGTLSRLIGVLQTKAAFRHGVLCSVMSIRRNR